MILIRLLNIMPFVLDREPFSFSSALSLPLSLPLFLYLFPAFIKNCVFSQFTATHPLQLICARDLSVQSLLLADHIVQPIAARYRRRRGRKYWKFLGKNTIFNEHPVGLVSIKILTHSNTLLALRSFLQLQRLIKMMFVVRSLLLRSS